MELELYMKAMSNLFFQGRTALTNEIARQINFAEHTAGFLCLIITVHYSESLITINLL